MWRDNLDPKIKEHFEAFIKEVSKEKSLYKESSKAQLWIAIAILNKKVSDLELKIKSLEKKNKPNKKLKKDLEKF
ncbi:hypothetical protein HN681_00340 [archaeon]|jgi:hypothetical protein|nr:hypothetical protein [archaeon]MBT3730767.1 hypothetical protein [archaeon]MBT4669669.1 hypothetical protein [archaeon]MBT5030426.1 hypothetical protein [archaeon]MBT5288281.1 hypothetical protein [archaeon]